MLVENVHSLGHTAPSFLNTFYRRYKKARGLKHVHGKVTIAAASVTLRLGHHQHSMMY